MLKGVRGQVSSIAAAVLLALMTGTLSEVLASHTPDEHDIGWTPPPAAVPHDESDHRLTSGQPGDPTHPLHCFLCHSARSFRPLRSAIAHQAPDLEPRASLHFGALPAPTTLVMAQLTLRSPPAALFVL
jgi:hypothetical protein